jgi:hypothetical protein
MEHDHKAHADMENTCILCRMHQSMHHKNACGMCCGSNHYGILRIILALGILTFVFWAGKELGEMTSERGYDEYSGYGQGRHMMIYRGDTGSNMMYGTVQVDTTAATKAIPAPGTPFVPKP